MRQALDFVDADALIDRLKRAAGVSSDTALSRALGLSHGAVHHWRKRGSLPADRVVSLADRLPNVSIEWLMTGKGSAKEAPLSLERIHAEQGRIDPDILRIALKEVSEVADQENMSPPLPIHDLPHLVIRYYNHFERLVVALCSYNKMTREQALITLERAAGLPPAPVTEADHLSRALHKRPWRTSYSRNESLKAISEATPEVVSSGESDQSN